LNANPLFHPTGAATDVFMKPSREPPQKQISDKLIKLPVALASW